jgi:hypothetical protein
MVQYIAKRPNSWDICQFLIEKPIFLEPMIRKDGRIEEAVFPHHGGSLPH